MSLIVAARFDTFEHAARAADALMKAGVGPDDLDTFYVNPPGAHSHLPIGGDRVADPASRGAPFGAVGGAAILAVVGAIIGSLIGFSLNNAILPVIVGAGVGAYIGSMMGGVSKLGRKPGNGQSVPLDSAPSSVQAASDSGAQRPSGVLLAVRVDAGQQQRISDLLRAAGGVEVERAQGRWEGGQWRDFNPLDARHVENDTRPGPVP